MGKRRNIEQPALSGVEWAEHRTSNIERPTPN